MDSLDPSPHLQTAGVAGCPQCGRDEAAVRARRRERQMEQLAIAAHVGTELISAFGAQAHAEMAAAQVARKLGEPGTVVADGAGWLSMRAADYAARMQRRSILMECRVEAGSLGAAPAMRGRRQALPPADAPGVGGMAGMGGPVAQMGAAVGTLGNEAGAGGPRDFEERLDAADPEERLETLDDELDDELADELDDELDDADELSGELGDEAGGGRGDVVRRDARGAAADGSVARRRRGFSSAMARRDAAELERMRADLAKGWKAGDPVPALSAMRELRAMAVEELVRARAAVAVDAARSAAQAAAADAVAQSRAPPPGAVAISRDGAKSKWAFADPEEGEPPVGALRPPWKPQDG